MKIITMIMRTCAAAGAVMALSCSDVQREAAIDADGREIRFSVVSDDTRGAAVTVQSSLDAGFRVGAVFDDDNTTYFIGKTVKSGEVWKMESPRYFVPGRSLTFYGVYPSSQDITLEAGAASLLYDADGNTDIVAGCCPNVSPTSGAVSLVLDHILSMAVFSCRGLDNTAAYKVTALAVTAPGGGTYSYADGTWTAEEDKVFQGVGADGKAVAADEDTEVQAMTFLPCTASVTVSWECYDAATGTFIESYEDTAEISLEKGKRAVINFLLPNNAASASFTVTMSSWGADEQTITVEKT